MFRDEALIQNAFEIYAPGIFPEKMGDIVMAKTTLNATFDGVSDVAALGGETRSFDDRFLGYYSVYESNPAKDFVLNASLTGNDWTVVTLRISAANEMTQMNLTDLDNGTGRRIRYLDLGSNSDVHLISTRVQYLFGADGDLHDVTLGSANTDAVNLYAALNKIQTASGWVGSIETDNRSVIHVGSGGAGRIQTGDGNDKVTTTDGYVGSIDTAKGNDNVATGSEFVNLISTGDGIDTVITGSGGIGKIWSGRGNDVISIGSGGAETVSTADGNDKVTTDTGFVGRIDTYLGDDSVRTGKGFVGAIETQDGADNLRIGSGGAGRIWTGEGNDVVKTTTAFVDSIDTSGGKDTVTIGKGGAGRVFTGDGKDFVKTNSGWVESISTSDGADKIKIGNGGAGLVRSGDGNDRLIGGRDGDMFHGGAGKDVHTGRQGADTFIFTAISDTANSQKRCDVITDMKHGEDLIDLRAIDASSGQPGNNFFTWQGTDGFGTSAEGEVYFKQFNKAGKANDFTMIYIDIDKDAASEAMIKLNGLVELTAQDFIL